MWLRFAHKTKKTYTEYFFFRLFPFNKDISQYQKKKKRKKKEKKKK